MAGKVIVTDDDPDMRGMLRHIFESEGWKVLEAADGFESVDTCQRESCDLLVLDHMMPGKSGMEVAKELRAQGFDRPIVLFSAYLSAPVMKDADELRIWPVSKVDLKGLVQVVRGLMRESEAAPES